MLGSQVVARALEQIARHRLGALDLAERDEYLADADERSGLPGGIAELAAKLQACSNACSAAASSPAS